jgi:membrane associated rhomboid family serine protease
MIPIKDYIRSKSFPVFNTAFIALNALVFIYQLSLPMEETRAFIREYGFMSGRFFENPSGAWTTIFTSMFLHGGLLHFLGNMLFLFVFGDNVEDALGHARYVMFYLLSGLAAVVAQAAFLPSPATPLVGASGAISAVLGAYILLYPMTRVLTIIPVGIFLMSARVPAFVFVGIWAMLQFFSGFLSIAGGMASNVGYFAHIGGFIFGVVFVLFGRGRYLDRVRKRHRTLQR